MNTFEEAAPAQRQETIAEAICWECGARTACYEYVVCCTGTLFHLCLACDAKVQGGGGAEAGADAATMGERGPLGP